jgi:hypothetical protein
MALAFFWGSGGGKRREGEGRAGWVRVGSDFYAGINVWDILAG